MRNIVVRLLPALVVVASLAACGGVDSPSSQTSEDFTGTLTPGGEQFKNFSVTKTGEMQVTLQSLTPRPVIGFMVLAVGQPVASICSPMFGYIVNQAAIGQQYSFPQIGKGSYCILISDATAALTQPAAFTVRFTHP